MSDVGPGSRKGWGPWGRREPPRWFAIEQDVRYECLEGAGVSASGAGQTLEISSKEIRFTSGHTFQLGEAVRLAVTWPAMLDDTHAIKLAISGRVVRTQAGMATVRIEHYEFRTGGPSRPTQPLAA